jgi:hypothetical protein
MEARVEPNNFSPFLGVEIIDFAVNPSVSDLIRFYHFGHRFGHRCQRRFLQLAPSVDLVLFAWLDQNTGE